ncbi:MAG: hypothetical protein OXE57_19330 [Alphaproteobacteria bacterium]|nr:hypothetical protein [Alphaproteobacteria bacterium]
MTANGKYARLVERIFRADRNLSGVRLSEDDVSRLAAILRTTAADIEADEYDALDSADPGPSSKP